MKGKNEDKTSFRLYIIGIDIFDNDGPTPDVLRDSSADEIWVPSTFVRDKVREKGFDNEIKVLDDIPTRPFETYGEMIYISLGAPIPHDQMASDLQREAIARGMSVEINQTAPLAGQILDRLPDDSFSYDVDSAMFFSPATVVEGLCLHVPACIEAVWNDNDLDSVMTALYRQYPISHPVHIVDVDAIKREKSNAVLNRCAVREIEAEFSPGGKFLMHLPAVKLDQNTRKLLVKSAQSAAGLFGVVHRLRSPGGCDWDRKQDHESLRPFLLEETHELLDALTGDDPVKRKEELGDVLLQVALHAVIAYENEDFDAVDVMMTLMQKMVHRHPHVFSDVQVADADEVEANWERIKRKSRDKNQNESHLDTIPQTLPALLQAEKIQSVVSRMGFDWDDMQGPADKIREETEEFADSLQEGNTKEAASELGDVLFSVVNAARHLEVSAETELLRTISKFKRRFRAIEEEAARRNMELDDMMLEEMDAIWDEFKSTE